MKLRRHGGTRGACVDLRRARGGAVGAACTTRRATRFLLVASALLASCASAPPPRFHSLLGAAPVERGAPSPAPLVVFLDPVRVPVQVDQPQWLVRLPDDSLGVLEAERWASPLRDELRQALLEVWVGRFGAVDGRTAGSAAPGWRVTVDVRRFETVPGREARIEGTWVIAPASASAVQPVRCDWAVREPVGAGMLALAAGHRSAASRLAESIGAQLAAAQSGAGARCAPP